MAIEMSRTTTQLHRRGVLIPLEQNFSTATTISILLMNRKDLDYDLQAGRPVIPVPGVVPANFKDLLQYWGYTRLYVLFLFTLAGDLSQLPDASMSDLVSKNANEIYRSIFKDSARVVMAHGGEPSLALRPLVAKRVEQIQSLVSKHCPDPRVYQFGELTTEGRPRVPEEVTWSDPPRPLYPTV